jgi:hypothetical protein
MLVPLGVTSIITPQPESYPIAGQRLVGNVGPNVGLTVWLCPEILMGLDASVTEILRWIGFVLLVRGSLFLRTANDFKTAASDLP